MHRTLEATFHFGSRRLLDEPKDVQKSFSRLGRLDDVVAYARKFSVDDVVLALPRRKKSE